MERRRKQKRWEEFFFSSLIGEVVPSPRADRTLVIFLFRFPQAPFFRYNSSLKTFKQAATLLEEAEEEERGQRRAKSEADI